MISRVEIINNPYIRKMRILINGEAPSAFGPLDKFFNEPFLYWCDRIFPELEKELNGGRFTLHFESRIEEIRILEKISQQYPICTQFSYREILRNTPLIDRMAFLNQLLKNQIPESYAIVKKVLFIVPDGEQKIFEEIKELKIENCYCRIENKCRYLFSDMPTAKCRFVPSEKNNSEWIYAYHGRAILWLFESGSRDCCL